MRAGTIITLAFVLGSSALTSSAEAQLIESVVAFVDDEPIFSSELSRRLEDEVATDDDPRDEGTRAREMLEKMIDDLLIRREAERLSVVVSEDEVERAMTLVGRQNGLDEAAFERALRTQHYEPGRYRIELRRQLLRMKVLQLRVGPVRVSEAELRRVWRQRVGGVPEAERRSFADAREALQRELMSARAAEAEERAMQALRDAAYLERRIEGL